MGAFPQAGFGDYSHVGVLGVWFIFGEENSPVSPKVVRRNQTETELGIGVVLPKTVGPYFAQVNSSVEFRLSQFQYVISA